MYEANDTKHKHVVACCLFATILVQVPKMKNADMKPEVAGLISFMVGNIGICIYQQHQTNLFPVALLVGETHLQLAIEIAISVLS